MSKPTKELIQNHKDGDALSMTEVQQIVRGLEQLEAALRDSLFAFGITQTVSDYPEDHWSRRAQALIGDES